MAAQSDGKLVVAAGFVAEQERVYLFSALGQTGGSIGLAAAARW